MDICMHIVMLALTSADITHIACTYRIDLFRVNGLAGQRLKYSYGKQYESGDTEHGHDNKDEEFCLLKTVSEKDKEQYQHRS